MAARVRRPTRENSDFNLANHPNSPVPNFNSPHLRFDY